MSVGSVNGDVPLFMFIRSGDGKAIAGKLEAGAEAVRHSVAQPRRAAGLGPAVADAVLGSVPGVSNTPSPEAVQAEVEAKGINKVV